MISKDSDFLNNKLKELKAATLAPKQKQQETFKNDHLLPEPLYPSMTNNYLNEMSLPRHNESQIRDFVDSEPLQVAKSSFVKQKDEPLAYTFKGSPLLNKSNLEAKIPTEWNGPSKVIPSYTYTDSKRPKSTNMLAFEKQEDISMQQNRLHSAFKRTVTLNESRENGSLPVKTVYALNGKSGIGGFQSENFAQDANNNLNYINIINNQRPGNQSLYPDLNLSKSSYQAKNEHYASPFGANERVSNLKTYSLMPGSNSLYVPPTVTEPENEILKSLNQQSFLDKHEHQLVNDLATKFRQEIDKNTRLSEDIMSLRQRLDAETRRSRELEEQSKKEYRHFKQNEQEKVAKLEALHRSMNELSIKETEAENKNSHLKSDLERMRKENEMLRSEIKRLGEMTSEKILDLENNINAISRMREFEVENFDMERDKIVNSAEFVIEQMRVHFNDRNLKNEDQHRRTLLEKDKASADLKTLTEELKSFNTNADIRITNAMNIVIQEEQERHEKEMREVESKIRAEEEEIGRATRKNQEMINRMHVIERDGKTRIMNKKNENVRLKEDLNGFEQTYHKLLVQIGNENRENDKKRMAIDSMQMELEELKDKIREVEDKYNEELQSINMGNDETSKELREAQQHFQDEEKRLLDEIREENEKVFTLQSQHVRLIEQIRQNINSTVDNQFSRANNQNNSKRNFDHF